MLIILNPNASKLCLKQIENGRVRLIQNLDKQKSFLKNDRVYLKIKNKRGGGKIDHLPKSNEANFTFAYKLFYL